MSSEMVPCRDTHLILVIGKTRYNLRPLFGEGRWVGWSLRKREGGEYHVARHVQGSREWWECTCADFGFRREDRVPEGCKHMRALRAWGLIP